MVNADMLHCRVEFWTPIPPSFTTEMIASRAPQNAVDSIADFDVELRFLNIFYRSCRCSSYKKVIFWLDLLSKHTTEMASNVFVASMNMRGKWAERPSDAILLNVTSMQGKTRSERIDLSPMSPFGVLTDELFDGFYCFEHWWQNGKVFLVDGVETQYIDWWKKQDKPKRRNPKTKGKKVAYATWFNKRFDYISSRKQIYIPFYKKLVENTETIRKYRELVKAGKKVVVYDFDGPRDCGSPICLEYSDKMLTEKLNDPETPFGHGYVVAALISGSDFSWNV
jgi:hypothetical protein